MKSPETGCLYFNDPISHWEAKNLKCTKKYCMVRFWLHIFWWLAACFRLCCTPSWNHSLVWAAMAIVFWSVSCTLALKLCVCVSAARRKLSLWEAFNILDSLQSRYPQPPHAPPILNQRKHQSDLISCTNGAHCSLYLILPVTDEWGFLWFTEPVCQRNASYHQVMNECEEHVFLSPVGFTYCAVKRKDCIWSDLCERERVMLVTD